MEVLEQLSRMDWLQGPLELAGVALLLILMLVVGGATPGVSRTAGYVAAIGFPLFFLGGFLGPMSFGRSTLFLLAALGGLALLAVALALTARATARRGPSGRAPTRLLVLVLVLDLGYLVVGYPVLYGMGAARIPLIDCPGDPACVEGQFDLPVVAGATI